MSISSIEQNLQSPSLLTAASTLIEKQAIYRKVLIQEFIREFNFLVDVSSDRASAKSDFTDKLLKILTLSLDIAGAVAKTGYNIIPIVVNAAIENANDMRHSDRFKSLGQLFDSIDPIELQILIEQVAHLASHRYAYFIDNILSNDPVNGIIPFAKAGVERMLEYLVRTLSPISAATLLQGLIEGRSGAYISGFGNTDLGSQQPGAMLTAEGAYGRSAFRTPINSHQHQRWHLDESKRIALEATRPKISMDSLTQQWNEARSDYQIHPHDSKGRWLKKKIVKKLEEAKSIGTWVATITSEQLEYIYASHSHYGYTHMENGQPKYGYVDLTLVHVNHYRYEKFGVPVNNYPNDRHYPQICYVTSDDIASYMQTIKPGNITLFRNFIKNIYGYPLAYPEEALAVYVTEVDKSKVKSLAYGDFSGVYFLGVDLGELNLQNTQFNQAFLWCCNLFNAKAMDASFRSAHLEYVEAQKCDFTKAILSQAHFEFSDLTGTTLTGIHSEGAYWYGAKLENIIDITQGEIEAIKVQQEQQKKEYEEQFAKYRIEISKQAAQIQGLIEEVSKHGQQQSEFKDSLSKLFNQLQCLETAERYLRQEVAHIKEGEVNNSLQIQNLEQDLSTQKVQVKAKFDALSNQFHQEINELKLRIQKIEIEITQTKEQIMQEPPKKGNIQSLVGGKAKIGKMKTAEVVQSQVHAEVVQGSDYTKVTTSLIKAAKELPDNNEQYLVAGEAEVEEMTNDKVTMTQASLKEVEKQSKKQQQAVPKPTLTHKLTKDEVESDSEESNDDSYSLR